MINLDNLYLNIDIYTLFVNICKLIWMRYRETFTVSPNVEANSSHCFRLPIPGTNQIVKKFPVCYNTFQCSYCNQAWKGFLVWENKEY